MTTSFPAPEIPGDGLAWDEQNRRFAALIVRAQAGSMSAFDELYERSARWLLSHVRRIVQDDGAEDVLAEVYIQVWRSLASYDAGRGQPAVWLCMIARSRALDHLRREKRHAHACEEPDADGLPADDGEGPEQLLWRAQQGRLVTRSLQQAQLSPQERMVIGLAYYGDKTQQEIARVTGLPLGTVKSLMSRAQRKLGAQFRGGQAEPGLRDGAGVGDRMAP
ncbi:MAG: RNA polymerase sigma factor [Ramlibacter sp.]